MADVNQTVPAADAAKAPKPKTVIDNMPGRTVKANQDEAIAFIKSAFDTYADFGEYQIVSPVDASRKDAEGNPAPAAGLDMDDEGNLVFDQSIFPPDMRVMICVLTQRGEGSGSSTVKAIVVAPVPSFDAIMADEAGKSWLNKIAETELNRAAVRVLRPSSADVDDITLLDQMPKSLSDYVTSNRQGASTLLEAFEDNWKSIKDGLGKLSKAWKLRSLSKKEFKNGLSSKAYASQWYPELEETKKGSLFEFALLAFIAEAKKDGKDYTIFETWQANRATHTIDADEEDAEELSLDALTAAMSSGEPAPAANPDTPATGQETETAPDTQGGE